LSYAEAARYLGISLNTIQRLKVSGELRHVPVGRLVRFRKVDLDDYLDAIARGGHPPRGYSRH